jgi:hypothetical protein
MKNAISHFDKKSLTYTYSNNGWSFTNFFDGNLRISEMGERGTLRETVAVSEISQDIFVITWEDEEMGPITQVVDFKQNIIIAALKWEGEMEIWQGVITEFI